MASLMLRDQNSEKKIHNIYHTLIRIRRRKKNEDA